MDNYFFDHSLLHSLLDVLSWPVDLYHAGRKSSIQRLVGFQSNLSPNPIHVDAMPGKSQNPVKRRKYRRSSILCHSHPSVPETITDSPISRTTGTPASRLFETPVSGGPYTPASSFSPSPLKNKQKASQSSESESPICDALVQAGILPDRGLVRPWPNDAVFVKPVREPPCEMNGIHEAMNRIRFKQDLIRAAEKAELQELQGASEQQFPGVQFTNSANSTDRNPSLPNFSIDSHYFPPLGGSASRNGDFWQKD